MTNRKPYDAFLLVLVILAVVVLVAGIVTGNWASIVLAIICLAIAARARHRIP